MRSQERWINPPGFDSGKKIKGRSGISSSIRKAC